VARRHLLVSYDVTDDRTRTRLARYLQGFFDRVQKSVFEGEIDDSKRAKLAAEVARLVDQEQDSVRFYTLCTRCCAATEIVGTGTYIEPDRGDVIL
jgi:CRISPR-associated protein Cas2